MFTTLKTKTVWHVGWNVVFQLLGKLATTLGTLLITILIARTYGPESYGELTIMLTYPALFYMLADFGLNMIYLRDAFTPAKIGESFSDLLGFRFVWSLALVLFALCLLPFLPYSPVVKIGSALALITIVAQALIVTTKSVFQARLRYDRSLYASIIWSFTALLIAVYSVYRGWPLWVIPLGFGIGGLLASWLSLYYVKHLIGTLYQRFNLARVKPYILRSLPLGFASFFSVLVGRGGHLVLSFLRPTIDLGLYGAAYKMFEVMLVLPTFAMNAIYPVLLRLQSQNETKFKSAYRFSLTGLVVVGFLTSVLGYLVSPWLIAATVGADFSSSIPALRLLFLFLPIFFVTAFFFHQLIIYHLQVYLPIIYGVGAVFNLGLNYYLVPRGGFMASVWLVGATEALILIMQIGSLLFRRKTHV